MYIIFCRIKNNNNSYPSFKQTTNLTNIFNL